MLYLDSSAFVKRYLREVGSELLQERLRSNPTLCSSAIGYAEIHATLARKAVRKEVGRGEFLQLRNRFELDWLDVQEIAVDRETLSPVAPLVESFDLRGMDAIHLAAAIWMWRKTDEKLELVTSDEDLLLAARSLGLTAWDPTANA